MARRTMAKPAALAAGLALAGAAGAAGAQTTQIAPSVYRVETGVAFGLLHTGNTDFRFAWSDVSGSFADIADPTLVITAGETYTFQRQSVSHPLAITDGTLPVAGTDGAYDRTTFSAAVIDAATLQPIEDFTADPAPTDDLIEWTPDPAADLGVYYYTCTILGHPGMTGRIEVVAPDGPCAVDVNMDGVVDGGDFFAWVAAFGSQGPGCDQNADGSCDAGDFFAFVAAFGQGCG